MIFGIDRQSARQFDDLLLANAQPPYGHVRVRRKVEPFQGGQRVLSCRGPIDKSAGAFLATQNDILNGGKLRHQAQFLVNHRDAIGHRVTGTAELHQIAPDVERAGIRLVHSK